MNWKQEVNRTAPFTCGFCGLSLLGWNERATHVASHFEKGETMSTWNHALAKGEAQRLSPIYQHPDEERRIQERISI